MNHRVNNDDMCMKYYEYSIQSVLVFHTCYFIFVNIFIKGLFNFSNYGINIVLFIRNMSAREKHFDIHL